MNCAYCNTRGNETATRRHYALNICGSVPRHTFLPFSESISEDAWRKEAEAIAKELGWLVAHVERSQTRGRWITNTTPGFPDTWFAHPAGHLVVIEFKSHIGKPKPEQVAWILALDRTPGVTARVYGPSDWPSLQHLLTAVKSPPSAQTHAG